MAISLDVPFAEYLTMPGEHFSTLKHMAISPLHYRRARDHERTDTPSLLVGRLTHALVLTSEIADVAVFAGKARRGRAWEEFRAESLGAGKIIVTRDQLDVAERMRDAVNASEPARELLANGTPEVTVTWEEELPTGPSIVCRARLDWLGDERIVELKTTRRPGAARWFREAAAYHYHVQLAHYREGMRANIGRVLPPWWIVVESAPPYDVAVYRVGPEHVEAGDRVRLGWLRRVAECESSGRWPGVGGDAPIDFVLPDYAATEGLDEVNESGIEGGADGE